MIFLAMVCGLFLIDFGIKEYVERKISLSRTEPVLGGRAVLRKHYNRGAMLNLWEHRPGLVKNISKAMVAVMGFYYGWLLPKKGETLKKTGMSFLLGGALGNTCDRVKRGYVIDYFNIVSKKKCISQIIFNVADLFIFAGSMLMLLSTLGKGQGRDGKR